MSLNALNESHVIADSMGGELESGCICTLVLHTGAIPAQALLLPSLSPYRASARVIT